MEEEEEPATSPERPSREELILAIAQLDEAFQASQDTSEEAGERYQARRKDLLTQLKSLS
jgi:propanediol dehydratase small subunit